MIPIRLKQPNHQSLQMSHGSPCALSFCCNSRAVEVNTNCHSIVVSMGETLRDCLPQSTDAYHEFRFIFNRSQVIRNEERLFYLSVGLESALVKITGPSFLDNVSFSDLLMFGINSCRLQRFSLLVVLGIYWAYWPNLALISLN